MARECQDGLWRVENQSGTHYWDGHKWNDFVMHRGIYNTKRDAVVEFSKSFAGPNAVAPPVAQPAQPVTESRKLPALRTAPVGTNPNCYNGKWILENVAATHYYDHCCGWVYWTCPVDGRSGWANTRDEVIQDYSVSDGNTLPVPTGKDSRKSIPTPTNNRIRTILERALELRGALESSGKYGVNPYTDPHDGSVQDKVTQIIVEHLTALRDNLPT